MVPEHRTMGLNTEQKMGEIWGKFECIYDFNR